MSHPIKAPKKLIEVALPLDDINTEAAREKSIRHGHPSTLHLWWARRPLAAARAVIFGQLVNDPASLWEHQNPGQSPSPQQKSAVTRRRNELFALIRERVKWESTNNEEILGQARAEIRRSWREVCALNEEHPDAASLFNPEKMPGLHDPFAGGGTIPLEAQRLGLEAFASDLNPVAVLINKAMIEIPPKFAGLPPVHPEARRDAKLRSWKGAQGLADDVRRYGAWMRDEAEKRIGHFYPKVKITVEMAESRPDLKPLVGHELTVIAWLWARTVKSPNPAFSHVDVPLVSSFLLGTKEGKEAWVEPVVDGDQYRFEVRSGKPIESAREGTKIARGSFRCICSGTPISYEYIDDEANAKRMGQRLMAIVAEGDRTRVYISPTASHQEIAMSVPKGWQPETPSRGTWASNAQGRRYGFDTFGDYFTTRQLSALSTLSDIICEARVRIRNDAARAGIVDDAKELSDEGIGATAYGQAVSVYLGFVVDKEAESLSTLCTWSSHPKNELVVSTFRRQALPMTWDFAESNPFAGSSGAIDKLVEAISRAVEIGLSGFTAGNAQQSAAQELKGLGRIISTDPPYYDNVSYADLSDYFYGWMRRTSRDVFPTLFASIAVPKAEELVATQYRHGSKEGANKFLLRGMTEAMTRLAIQAHPSTPTTIYYAFKQSETDAEGGTSSSGWDTFLDAVLQSGFTITGTWPVRTEREARSTSIDTNALASSIVLVCRRRPENAPTTSRRQFQRELNAALPLALDEMTQGSGEDRSPVAPVDLSQAIIGPGMAIFSKYAAVLEADGSPMSVRTALQLINRFLAEDDFDADTQFCLRWFEQHEWGDGAFGEADVLARAKATSVAGLADAGVLQSDKGRVRLLRWSEYTDGWDPKTDKRLPIWEVLHQLIREHRQNGDAGAGRLLAIVQAKAEATRQLAYRLYTLCERRGLAEEARAYNEIVTSWSGMESAASTAASASAEAKRQQDLFGRSE